MKCKCIKAPKGYGQLSRRYTVEELYTCDFIASNNRDYWLVWPRADIVVPEICSSSMFSRFFEVQPE